MFKNPSTKEEAQRVADSMFAQLETMWANSARQRASEHGGHYGVCVKCEQQWEQLLQNSGVLKMDKLAKQLPSMYDAIDETLATEVDEW